MKKSERFVTQDTDGTVQHTFTRDEMVALTKELGQAYVRAENVRTREKEVKAELKADVEAAESAYTTVLRTFMRGSEERRVPVRKTFDLELGTVTVAEILDDGTLAEAHLERRMTAEEQLDVRQLQIAASEPAGARA